MSAVATGFKSSKEHVCKCKCNFIDKAGLHISDTNCEDFLAKLDVYEVEPLEEAYPPYGKIISKTPTIHKKWYNYSKNGKQSNKQLKHLPIHCLSTNKLTQDIGPTESARLMTPDCKLVGLVICDLFPSKDTVE